MILLAATDVVTKHDLLVLFLLLVITNAAVTAFMVRCG